MSAVARSDGGLYAYALAADVAGLCVVPPKQDGSKEPIGKAYTDENGEERYGWTPWQSESSTLEEISRWYERDRKTGIGFVCGTVSGNLELFEFDCRLTYEHFKATAEALGMDDLISRIEAGYRSDTPGGGVHWLTRCDEIAGNTKLARRPKRPEEKKHPNDNVQVLIETRGEGGYTVEAPSNGKVHPTGGAYRLISGSVGTIATISAEERRFLRDLAETFDEMPESAPHAEAEQRARFDDTIRVGPVREAYRQGVIGDFNARATWEEVLGPHGWEFTKSVGRVQYVRRPGKDRSQSGTINFGGSDKLCVFSSSTGFKQTDRKGSKAAYDKFGAYAVLHHRGDQKAAYHDLSDQGYGTEWTPAGASGIADALDAVPAFPLETLPPTFRALVVEAAAALPCPPDFVAVPLLVAAGVAIGNGLELELKPGWREGPNLYAATVGDPGSKKTPALEKAMRPLYGIQKRLAREHQRAVDAFKVELATWEGKKKSERGPKPEPPAFRHTVTTDATTEALAPMLLAAKSIALTKDELSGWVRGMDQYRAGGKGADRQHYLSMWSRSAIKVDRKGSPAPIFVPRPCLSVLGGIQPDLLPELADAAQREDGFVDRVLWAYPDAVPDRWTTDGIRLETVHAVDAMFEALYRVEGEADEDGELGPRVVRLGAEAAAIWRDWYAEHAAEMAAEGFPRRLRGPWAKLPGQLARLTLVLHAAWSEPVGDVDGEVGGRAIGAAADLIDYFRAHARRVYRRLARGRRDLAVTILQGLKERGAMNERAIYRDLFHSNVPAERIKAALEALEEARLVRRERQPGETGRPATIWAPA